MSGWVVAWIALRIRRALALAATIALAPWHRTEPAHIAAARRGMRQALITEQVARRADNRTDRETRADFALWRAEYDGRAWRAEYEASRRESAS